MRRGDREFLMDILEACRRIKNYTKGLSYEVFLRSEEKQDAVIRNMEVIGEAVKHISYNLRNKYPEVDWKKVAGIRDKLIHFYFGISLEIVWTVIEKEIPKLEESVKRIMEKEGWSYEF
ncbi:MAG: DUF86 domain-containing protein [Deltaproteobacteria bacterium]|nr:MAG: DUF86 domain-containing protein [Deltaproteobacteria bacterium]